MSRKVLILQRRLPQYRQSLFESLHAKLADNGIDLTLAVGEPTPGERLRQDDVALPWAVKIPTRYISIDRYRSAWLSLPRDLCARQDLLILPHENNLLSNHPILARRRGAGPLVAFWGHGANFQARNPAGLGQSMRTWTARKADWWFAYTGHSVARLKECGVPEARITCLNNAIDTKQLHLWQEEISPAERRGLLAELGLQGEAVGIVLGSLHGHRRLPFLFATADEMKRRLPMFEMIVIGDGPEHEKVKAWAVQRNWVRWVGARQGRDKVRYASLGHCLLNPGMVGLNILDGFALGLPLVTTNCGIHSPEIAYLEPGANGEMTANNIMDYATAVVRLFRDPAVRDRMVVRCRESAQRYTEAAMVDNFVAGIRHALGETPARWIPPLPAVRHVAVVWQRFLPYHAARVRHLREVLKEKGIRLSAIEVASSDASYAFAGAGTDGEAPWVTCFPGANYNTLSAVVVRERVQETLLSLNPDVVLAPATPFPEGMAALCYRHESGARAVVMDDAWAFTDRRGWLTDGAKRLLHRQADAVFMPAPSHLPYYVRLGFPVERTVSGVDVVDNEFFAQHADAARVDVAGMRATLELPENYFLFVGRFLPRKGVDTLLAAYAVYRSQAEQPWDLVLVGGGPEETALKRQARDLAGVHFAGVRTGEELCHHYGLARALIVPSESDPWALVVNEGMAAGLPVLVSRGCGCARTLVHEGANGRSFAPGDAQELADRMLALARLPDADLKAMGQCSRKIITNWDLDRFAEGVLQALKIPRRPAAGFLSNLAVRLWKGRVREN